MNIGHATSGIAALALVATALAPIATAEAQEAYVGEIRMVGFGHCPGGWTEANGQLLSIEQYSALFSLFGTTYGGDGRSNFGLPDLRGSSAIHIGQGPGLSNFVLGQKGGTETNTLAIANLPSHTHSATSSLFGTTLSADSTNPSGRTLAAPSRETYAGAIPNAKMQDGSVTTTVGNTGNGQPVNNREPYLALRFCIVLDGIFPTRN